MTLQRAVILPGTFPLQSATPPPRSSQIHDNKTNRAQTTSNTRRASGLNERSFSLHSLCCQGHTQLYNQPRVPTGRIRISNMLTAATPARLYLQTLRGSTSPWQLRCFWKYQRRFSGALRMAGRALDNRRTPPSSSPAKTGALMSPLHEGSVSDTSWSTGLGTQIILGLNTHTHTVETHIKPRLVLVIMLHY